MMNYRLVILEDDKETYENLINKINKFNTSNSIIKIDFLGIPINPNTTFDDYVQDLLKYEGDIYIVDWVLKLKGTNYNPKDIFYRMQKKGLDFKNKYWVFYSGPSSAELLDFIKEYFIYPGCYETPGKGNLTGPTPASGRDHFADCINNGINYILKISIPQAIKDIRTDPNKIIKIPHFKGGGFDLNSPDYSKATEKKTFTVSSELFICLAHDTEYGIFIYFSDDPRKLQVYILKFNDSTSTVKEVLKPYTLQTKGFIYNSIYFYENSTLLSQLKPLLDNSLSILKENFSINKHKDINISKLIGILKSHDVV